MISDLDTYRAAGVIIKQYGEDAPIHAAMRADAALDAGDLDELAVWKRMLRAVEELQREEPTSGEAVHRHSMLPRYSGPGRCDRPRPSDRW